MIDSLQKRFSLMENGIRGTRTVDKIGTIHKVTGLILESDGPEVTIGQVCTVSSERHKTEVEAEVVGFSGNNVLLMALDSIHLIHPGCNVCIKYAAPDSITVVPNHGSGHSDASYPFEQSVPSSYIEPPIKASVGGVVLKLQPTP